MAYISEGDFEKQYPHRDISVWPTTAAFAEWIVDATALINNELMVTSDVTDSDGIIRVIISEILESWLVWSENQADDDSVHTIRPGLTEEQNLKLARIRGSEDEPAYYFVMDNRGGGAIL